MSDLIERQDALDALEKIGWIETKADKEYAVQLFTDLPSAQPERKKGKWIPQDLNKHYGMTSTTVYYYPKCSMCGESANYTNFCPNCGSYNGGENDQSK